jgi:hypothetical protein
VLFLRVCEMVLDASVGKLSSVAGALIPVRIPTSHSSDLRRNGELRHCAGTGVRSGVRKMLDAIVE